MIFFVIKNNDTNGDIIIGVSGKDKTLIITPEGNVGIGTTIPLGVFDIRGGNLIIPENSSKVGIGISNPNNQVEIINTENQTSILIKQQANCNVAEIYNQDNLTFVINSNSNVGIGGIVNPNELLHIHRNFNADIGIRLSDSNSPDGVLLTKLSKFIYTRINF